MKKLNRFGVLLGLLAGAGVITFVPSALAQDAEFGPENDMDISMESPMPPPMPGMMGPFQGAAQMMGEPGEAMLMALHGGPPMLFSKDHKMTDDQLEKIHKVKSEFMDRSAMKMAELKIQERALHDMLTEPDFEKGKAQSIQNKINGLHDEIANLKLDEHMSFLNCLTADQRTELRKAYVRHSDFGGGMMGHRPMMHMRHGGHGGGHGGPGGHHWEGHGEGHGEHGEHHEHHDGSPPAPGSDKS